MTSTAAIKNPSPTPGLVSYYNTEGAAPPGKVDVSANVIDVHDVSISRAYLEKAYTSGHGLAFELKGGEHSHVGILSPAQVGILVATGHLEVRSEPALLHTHKVRFSPGDGCANQDIRIGDAVVGKRWVCPRSDAA
jgi:hypothetical protein